MKTKTPEKFLKMNYPILYQYLLKEERPTGIDEIVCKAMQEYHEQFNQWISVEDELPPEDDTVWLVNFEKNFAILGCRAYPGNADDGWVWAESNGIIYVENGKIVSECDFDDLDITHWQPLPEIPRELITNK